MIRPEQSMKGVKVKFKTQSSRKDGQIEKKIVKLKIDSKSEINQQNA